MRPIFKLHLGQYGRTYTQTTERRNRGAPMDSLSALGVFVRAAEARSFTDAGRRLSVSSSAVGKTYRGLRTAWASGCSTATRGQSP